MPDIGQYVLVAHLSNGNEAGIVLGGYWNKNHKSVGLPFSHHPYRVPP